MNKSVEIYDVKVLDDNLNGNVNDIINGIKWSIKNDVDIINMSFGFQSYDKELQKIIHEAKQKGIILVGAVGMVRMNIVTILLDLVMLFQ